LEVPAVSVIIPMYNAEKYVGECLDSILNQTFQNFEVIVVDDCSTDNSFAIVESFIPKFGGRLILTKTKKNSSSPAEPCNLGTAISCGDYLFFMDNDDAITPTALEELYSVTKNFDADVVACEKFYSVPKQFWYNAEFRKQLKPSSYKKGDFVDSPTLLSDDLSERVKDYNQGKFLWPAWTKLIRRKFLAENKIQFEQTIVSDLIFTTCLIFSAKKWVRVPNVVNYWRMRTDSLSNVEKDLEKYLSVYSRALTVGFNCLDKFLEDTEFFQQNPDAKYIVLKTYVEHILQIYFLKIYSQISNEELYEILATLDKLLRRNFVDSGAAFTTFIFGMLNAYRKEYFLLQKRIEDLRQASRQDKIYISELENFIAKLLDKE